MDIGNATTGDGHDLTSMKDHLHGQCGCARTAGADVIGCRFRLSCFDDFERTVHVAEKLDQVVAVTVESVCRCGGEHGIALELRDVESGLDSVDHRIEQRSDDRVAGGYPMAEVDAVAVL